MVFANPPVTMTSRVPMVAMAVTAGSVGAVAVTAPGAVLLPLAFSMPFHCMLALFAKAGAAKFPVSSSMLAPTAGRGGCICRSRSAQRHRVR